MNTIKPHFTAAKRAGDFVFVSGQLPFDAEGAIVPGGITSQTRCCIDNIRRALEREGLQLSDTVKVGVWLTDSADFPAFNKIYAEYFPHSPPARTTVGATLMVPDALIEMDAQAHVG